MQKRVSIIGLGYIGLPTAIVAAEAGYQVIGVDIDAERVHRVNAGDPVIQEPGALEKLHGVVQNKKLRATTEIEPADYHIIAVPTPFHENDVEVSIKSSLGHDSSRAHPEFDESRSLLLSLSKDRRIKRENDLADNSAYQVHPLKKADLSYVWAAAETVAKVLRAGDTIILESTVPVGTTEKLGVLLEKQTSAGKAGIDFFVAHCPERVLPGKIFHELVHNARIIGGINPVSVERAKEFYKAFVTGGLYLTDAKTAEMVKLVENSSRDVAIAFANQVASMAQAIGLNGYEVIELANKHPRVNILRPGCGVGGHCIAVDPWFLIEGFPGQTHLLHAARLVNDAKPDEVVKTVQQHMTDKDLTILVLGATYKPDVDDLRESPALHIAQTLNAQYKNVMVCEPNVSAAQLIKKGFAAEQVVTFEDGIKRADVVISLVSHSAFKNLGHYKNTKKIIDYCGLLHAPRQDTAQQERLYWPANNSVEWNELNIGITAQSKNLNNHLI